MNSFIIILFILGIILITVGYVKENSNCPPPLVQFRYIPKTFNEEQNIHQPLVSIYGNMFKDPSPWETTKGYSTQSI